MKDETNAQYRAKHFTVFINNGFSWRTIFTQIQKASGYPTKYKTLFYVVLISFCDPHYIDTQNVFDIVSSDSVGVGIIDVNFWKNWLSMWWYKWCLANLSESLHDSSVCLGDICPWVCTQQSLSVGWVSSQDKDLLFWT